tara:strand:+ start:6752 stop:8596 length:1845 start_codon:yes stop_codon:yes gene_type:complete
MADIIQIRRDTAANWTSANPTLAQGELGYETDTDKMKIGDGATAWATLPYFIAGGIALADLSAAVAAAGTANLTYNNTTGVFTYTPPDLTSYATATSTTAFTNKSGNISQWTNDSGYTTTAGTVTPSSTDTFTNKSGAISQWTNDVGYSTSDTTYTAGTGLLLTGTVFSNTIINNNQLTNGAGYTTNTGTVTPSSTDIFTNKSGSNLQWTNDAGYSTTAGTVTPSSTDTFTNKSGDISQWTNDAGYLTTAYVLPVATSTVLGGVEIFSDVVQTVAANAVTATASKTYGVQLDSSGRAVVNVPWSSSGGGIALTDLSAVVAAAGTANLSYNNTNGVFTYTPPDLTSTDTLDSVTSRGATTTNAITVGGFTSTGIDDNATSTAITIDSDERVGVNITPTNRTFEVKAIADAQIVASFETGSGVAGRISIADANTTADSSVGIGSSGDNLSLYAGAAARATLSSAGNLSVTGNLTCLGIDDNATSVAVTIDASENVGIKNVSPTVALDVTGAILASADITAYSDIRLKADIQPIGDALDKVGQLRGVTFLRSDEGDGVRHTGLIAQDLQAVLPEAVRVGTDENETLSVAYGNTVGLLVEAIKELRAEVEALKNGSSI